MSLSNSVVITWFVGGLLAIGPATSWRLTSTYNVLTYIFIDRPIIPRITLILALIKERCRESRWNIDGLLQVSGTSVLRQISVFARQHAVLCGCSLLRNSPPTTRISKRLDFIVFKNLSRLNMASFLPHIMLTANHLLRPSPRRLCVPI
ncbi:hypothetical protein EDD85DRAFT_253941 [Armillaria nabsnona]|nr:hypothetical protein EDD85DRAFT_253941 [Armillaria nabsnona]